MYKSRFFLYYWCVLDDQLTPENAVDALQKLLAQQSEIERLKTEENRLNAALLAEQQRTNDLAAKKLELEQQAERRREHRLNEVLQRLIAESEARTNEVEILRETVSLMAAKDDGLQDLVDIILENDKAMLQAMMALLSRNTANVTESESIIKARYELTQHIKNLNNLKIRAARHGALAVPTDLTNEIDLEEQRITELQEILSNQ